MAAKSHSIFDPAMIVPAIGDSFKKLNPVTLAKNPVMFVTEVGAAITTVLLVTGHSGNFGFQFQIALWLWFTVLFANFAEAMAEGRGKAQARALRATRTQTFAKRLTGRGTLEQVPADKLRKGDVVVVCAGELIPGDGEVVEGAATVDESAITGESALGTIPLKDIVKGGLSDRFERFRAMGIRTVMITGDNPLTAAAIAKESGVDDFLAEAKPEHKLALIRKEQLAGHLVAMTGDGTNDAPALAQADVGFAMNTGTQAAKEAGNMVDLDSNPTKLIEVVEIGKQLLITRGALTTFSIANDVAKYFAILPAMLVGTFPQIAPLNIMLLKSPVSAILSAVIFNAVIIIGLIPLALKGVSFRPFGAVKILARNLFIYWLGGIILPFIGIKVIDMIIIAIGLA
jgi:high-affinity K+ transport system ATPase subunit B